MKARYHVLAGAAASSLLAPVLGINSAVFFASSVLIDADHYLDYLYRNRLQDFSVKNMFLFHGRLWELEKSRPFLGLSVAHTVEFLLAVYAASALTDWLWLKAALWGMLFHMVADLIYLYRLGWVTHRALSVVEFAIRWNRRKNAGLRPELPYLIALASVPGLSSKRGKKGAGGGP